MSEANGREAWAEAFTAAQAQFPEIKKERTVTVETKSGGSYSYQYADLPYILELVNPILKAHGLAVGQSAVSNDHGAIGVETRIFHKGGHVESFGPLYLPGGDDPQAAGSAVTYARRYSLCAALGIAADEDDDATAASARTTRPEVIVPQSPTDPHCPACLAVNGELVAIVGPADKKPFWKCTNRPEDCGGQRTYKGQLYSWAGWHESWQNSVAEYTGKPITGEPETRTIDPDERTNRIDYIARETMEIAGMQYETDARALMRQGLITAISEGSVDTSAALGFELADDPTDDELRVVLNNLTLAEADAVATAAANLGAPFDE